MTSSLNVQIQKKLYRLILQNPGVKSNDLSKMLKIDVSEIEKYIHHLENENKVYSLKGEGCVRYYIRRRRKGLRDKKTADIRELILQMLTENPGLHLGKIAEKLQMSGPLAKYHLHHLEKQNLIMSVVGKRGYYKRFYIRESGIGVHDKELVALFRQEHLLRIVVLILRHPNIKHKDLSEKLGIHPSTLTHHLIHLDEYDIINVFTYGNMKGYAIKNSKEIISIIRRYITEKKLDLFKDAWDEFYFEGRKK